MGLDVQTRFLSSFVTSRPLSDGSSSKGRCTNLIPAQGHRLPEVLHAMRALPAIWAWTAHC